MPNLSTAKAVPRPVRVLQIEPQLCRSTKRCPDQLGGFPRKLPLTRDELFNEARRPTHDRGEIRFAPTTFLKFLREEISYWERFCQGLSSRDH